MKLVEVSAILKQQRIETPTWAFGATGTRFGVFPRPGVARNVYEKIDDAAVVHAYTGVAPSVALHIPWDRVDNYGNLNLYANDRKLSIGAINPNVFQEPEYRLGSVCHPEASVRHKAMDHLAECVEIARATNSRVLSLWFGDGTNYPGQDNLCLRQERLSEALRNLYAQLDPNMVLLLEYKPFEPAFYSTDIPDWGSSLVHCMELGPQARVLVDTGHHMSGSNVEFIVMMLLRLGRLGGFHFNSRFYADDDLIVGAADPFQLFRIMHEIVSAGTTVDRDIAFMLDQCHNIEEKIPAQIRSIMNVQEATAKALLVDHEALLEAQRNGNVVGANGIIMNAFNSDVRPLLESVREEMGVEPNPLEAYSRSGHGERIQKERDGGTIVGWGA